MTNYQYGVFYEGQGLGWVQCDSLIEAQWELQGADYKHLPGKIGRKPLGSIEFDEKNFFDNNQYLFSAEELAAKELARWGSEASVAKESLKGALEKLSPSDNPKVLAALRMTIRAFAEAEIIASGLSEMDWG